eukprot:1080964-Pelagomonas_calceolata.AAC.3
MHAHHLIYETHRHPLATDATAAAAAAAAAATRTPCRSIIRIAFPVLSGLMLAPSLKSLSKNQNRPLMPSLLCERGVEGTLLKDEHVIACVLHNIDYPGEHNLLLLPLWGRPQRHKKSKVTQSIEPVQLSTPPHSTSVGCMLVAANLTWPLSSIMCFHSHHKLSCSKHAALLRYLRVPANTGIANWLFPNAYHNRLVSSCFAA